MEKAKIGQMIGKQTSGIHGMSVTDLCHNFCDFLGQCFGSVVVVSRALRFIILNSSHETYWDLLLRENCCRGVPKKRRAKEEKKETQQMTIS